MPRRTGKEGLHARVVEDKRERADRNAARREMSNAQRRLTERALLGRVRRKLAHDGEILVVERPGSQLERELGRYRICDARSGNTQCAGDADALVRWARDLGVLHLDEALA